MSSCAFTEDETSDSQAEGIVNKVRCLSLYLRLPSSTRNLIMPLIHSVQIISLKNRLVRLRNVINEKFPEMKHLVPSPDDVSPNGKIVAKAEDNGTPSTESDCILLPSKWKKDVEMGWRMDVNVDVQSNSDDVETTGAEQSDCESEDDNESETD